MGDSSLSRGSKGKGVDSIWLFDRRTNSTYWGILNCHRWWARASKGREAVGGFYMGMRKVTPTFRRQRRRERQDFMSCNSLGSPTFMFYPVIMMSTYTPDKTKHYPRALFSLSLSFFALFPHLAVVIGIRPRRGNATHFCEEESVQALTSILLLLYRLGDASGWPRNAYRLASDSRILIAAIQFWLKWQ